MVLHGNVCGNVLPRLQLIAGVSSIRTPCDQLKNKKETEKVLKISGGRKKSHCCIAKLRMGAMRIIEIWLSLTRTLVEGGIWHIAHLKEGMVWHIAQLAQGVWYRDE